MNTIKLQAKELVKQYGEKAINVATSKINGFPHNIHSREKDFAIMVLTEVEKLLKSK